MIKYIIMIENNIGCEKNNFFYIFELSGFLLLFNYIRYRRFKYVSSGPN